MTPAFADRVEPVLDAALRLRDGPGGGRALAAGRERLQTLIQAAARPTHGDGALSRDCDLAARGLVYWADELLQARFGAAWDDDSLEQRFFRSRDRGYLFYCDFEEEGRTAGPDVAELWYLLLALGFRGDIELAFEKLNRPLPAPPPSSGGSGGSGGRFDAARPGGRAAAARAAWAKGLARRRVRAKVPALEEGPPPDGDVRLLRGTAMLTGAALLAAGLACVAAVLGAMAWPELRDGWF